MEADSSRPLTICLFVDHGDIEIQQSLYKIALPVDLSDYEEEEPIDWKESFTKSKPVIYPAINFPDADTATKLLFRPETAKLGSKIYFFGGFSHGRDQMFGRREDEKLLRAVHVLDMDQPEQRPCAVAPLNAAKERPCVFVADGMIYALGTAIEREPRLIPGYEATGCFERYDPNSNKWQVLPDPPLGYNSLLKSTWSGYATVVGRYVFIGSQIFHCRDEPNYLIYNLDSQKWEETPPKESAIRFPYGSLYVDEYLYHIRGGDPCASGIRVWDHPSDGSEPAHIVKRGPFTVADGKGKGDPCSLLKRECLDFDKAQVVATSGVLDDEHKLLFTNRNFNPWRSLIHLGGRYFCYIVAAIPVDCIREIFLDEDNRWVRIKVFEEVVHGKNNKSHIRVIASFSYRLHNPMDSNTFKNHILCCALGTIPNSWIKASRKKKEKSKSRLQEGDVKIATTVQENQDLAARGFIADKKDVEQKVRENEVADLQKLLAIREKEIKRLLAEMAMKDEILRTYGVR